MENKHVSDKDLDLAREYPDTLSYVDIIAIARDSEKSRAEIAQLKAQIHNHASLICYVRQEKLFAIEQQLEEYTKALNERNAALLERDAQLAAAEATIARLNAEIEAGAAQVAAVQQLREDYGMAQATIARLSAPITPEEQHEAERLGIDYVISERLNG